MIHYIEKGLGLHQAIRQAGHTLEQRDGVWVASDEVLVQAIIDSYTLEQAKALKSAAVSLCAKRAREAVTAMIAAGEMASWPIKRAEAEQFAAVGESADCPSLRAEALARGITLSELVTKVLVNAARFVGAEAAIGGADGRHRDAIAELSTFEAVAAYDYSTGWPEV